MKNKIIGWDTTEIIEIVDPNPGTIYSIAFRYWIMNKYHINGLEAYDLIMQDEENKLFNEFQSLTRKS